MIILQRMPTVQINTAFNVGLDFEIAPFYKRLLAYGIDCFLLIVYLWVMKDLLYEEMGLSVENNIGPDILLVSLPMLIYSLVTETLLNGQTLGKKIMQIRVISIEGGEPDFGQFVMRWITKVFEWPIFFGYIYSAQNAILGMIVITGFLGIPVIIMILVTKKAQRLGDMIAGTTVVDAKSNMSVGDTIFIDVNTANYKVTFPEVMRLSDNDINTITTVLRQSAKTNNYDMCMRVEHKIKEVLKISSNLPSVEFLQKLLQDYNYLATKE